MKTNNKVRGGAFERKICKLLSNWWTGNGADSDVFYRTESSGGRGTARARAGKQTKRCGDVGAVDEVGLPLVRLMSIELKLGYSESTIQDLLDKPGAALQTYEKWLDQAEESARNSGTPYWLIIVQRTRRKALVIMPAALAAHAMLDAPDKVLPYPQCFFHIAKPTRDDLRNHLCIMQLDAFLQCTSRRRIEEVHAALVKEE